MSFFMDTIIESPELHNSSNGESFVLLIKAKAKQIASKEIMSVGIIYFIRPLLNRLSEIKSTIC